MNEYGGGGFTNKCWSEPFGGLFKRGGGMITIFRN